MQIGEAFLAQCGDGAREDCIARGIAIGRGQRDLDHRRFARIAQYRHAAGAMSSIALLRNALLARDPRMHGEDVIAVPMARDAKDRELLLALRQR